MTIDYEKEFTSAGSTIPILPHLLSRLSDHSSTSFAIGKRNFFQHNHSEHFFATVVQSKHLLQIYRDVIVWLLKREIIIVLHLHVRIVATREVKQRVKMAKEKVDDMDEEKRYERNGLGGEDRMTGGRVFFSEIASLCTQKT